MEADSPPWSSLACRVRVTPPHPPPRGICIYFTSRDKIERTPNFLSPRSGNNLSDSVDEPNQDDHHAFLSRNPSCIDSQQNNTIVTLLSTATELGDLLGVEGARAGRKLPGEGSRLAM